MQFSFKEFWASELSVPVAQRYNGFGLMKKRVQLDENEVIAVQQKLHDYAQSPINFSTEVRAAINAVGPRALRQLFITPTPGMIEFVTAAA